MFDYINGNKFAVIADIVIDLDHPNIDFNRNENAIIFCKTDFLLDLFGYLYLGGGSGKFILISHMSDKPITNKRFDMKPLCIKKWFAENAVYDHEDLIPIPLGLENHIGKSKGKYTNHEWLDKNQHTLPELKKGTSLYCNWVDSTNAAGRKMVIKQLQETSFSLCIESGLLYEEYCMNMAQHRFVICPPGHGADTHRVWEALYFGCVPIVIKNHIYDNYNLPILQLESYKELTTEMIEDFLKKDFNYKQLYMEYWEEKIEVAFKKI